MQSTLHGHCYPSYEKLAGNYSRLVLGSYRKRMLQYGAKNSKLCQAGAQVFDPVFHVFPLIGNVGSLSVTLTVERGCNTPSTVRNYSAQKQGYSNYYNIP
jgi:hypothetical protein